ncbi:MAG: hypothetical protein ACKODH_03290, partial [Limisphaerales bacterium]
MNVTPIISTRGLASPGRLALTLVLAGVFALGAALPASHAAGVTLWDTGKTLGDAAPTAGRTGWVAEATVL